MFFGSIGQVVLGTSSWCDSFEMKQENENSSCFYVGINQVNLSSYSSDFSQYPKLHSDGISESRPLRRIVSVLKFFTGNAEIKP